MASGKGTLAINGLVSRTTAPTAARLFHFTIGDCGNQHSVATRWAITLSVSRRLEAASENHQKIGNAMGRKNN